MEFKQITRRITCKLCHYTADYDLLKGKHSSYGDSVEVTCKGCSRPIRGRMPSEMSDYLLGTDKEE